MSRIALLGGALTLGAVSQACARLIAATPTPVSAAGGQLPKATATTKPAAPTATATPAMGITPDATATPAPTLKSESTMTPAPAATPQTSGVPVAFVKTNDRAEGVRRAIALLGIAPARGKDVLLKPNYNSADPSPGSTHNDTLLALIAALRDMGAGKITVADRSGMGDTRTVMRDLGVLALAQEHDFDTVVYDELPDDQWTLIQEPGKHWQAGYPVPTMLLDAECVVQTCNLKTHRFGGHFTLSLKNSVGLVGKQWRGYNYMSELHGSKDQRLMIAECNSAYSPALIVMDGVVALTTGGPDKGKQVNAQVMLASTDRVAIDAVGVALLRLYGTTPAVSQGRVFEQEQLARAVELGLGVSSAAEITLLTDDDASAAYAAEVREMLDA